MRTWVRRPRSNTPEEALARVDERVLAQCGLEYSDFAALRPDDDPYTEGLDLATDIVPCHSRQEALSLARGWQAWGVAFLAREVPGDIYLYVYGVERNSFGAPSFTGSHAFAGASLNTRNPPSRIANSPL